MTSGGSKRASANDPHNSSRNQPLTGAMALCTKETTSRSRRQSDARLLFSPTTARRRLASVGDPTTALVQREQERRRVLPPDLAFLHPGLEERNRPQPQRIQHDREPLERLGTEPARLAHEHREVGPLLDQAEDRVD